jgi:hypothetical protein
MGVSGQRHATGRFTVGRESRCPLYGRLGGPQGWSRGMRKISSPSGLDPQVNRSIIIIIIIIIVCMMNTLVKHRFFRHATRWAVGGSNLAWTRFSLPFQTYRGAFPRVQRLERDADGPSSAALQIDRSCTSACRGMSGG